jgi:RHS repeat-associated protein
LKLNKSVARQSTIAAVTNEATINYDNNDRLVADSYDNNGNTIESQGRTYRYAGEQWDADLGLYYNRARYLDVDRGRFWTSDSFEGEIEDPLSLHKYLYAGLDPINKIDPSGNSFVEKGTATAIRATLATGAVLGRITPILYFASLRLAYYLFANATKLEFYVDLTVLASEFLESGTNIILNNTSSINYRNDPPEPGEWVEMQVGANKTEYEIIDDFRERNVTSIKTNQSTTIERCLRKIKEYTVEIGQRKRSFQPKDENRKSSPPINLSDVRTRTLFVVIPENHISYLSDKSFINAINQLQRANRVIIRVVPLRGWRK